MDNHTRTAKPSLTLMTVFWSAVSLPTSLVPSSTALLALPAGPAPVDSASHATLDLALTVLSLVCPVDLLVAAAILALFAKSNEHHQLPRENKHVEQAPTRNFPSAGFGWRR